MSCGHSRKTVKQTKISVTKKASSVKPFRTSRHNRKKQTIKSLPVEAKEADQFRIFDENDQDVTPRPIIDYVRLNISLPERDDDLLNTRRASKYTLDNLEMSLSDKSTTATTNLTSSMSRIGKTGTQFSLGVTLDIGTRLIADAEHLLIQTQSDQTFDPTSDNEISKALFLPGVQQKQIESITDSIILTETETIFILDLTAHFVSKDDVEEYQNIEEKNQRYLHLCKNRLGNDAYLDRGMQTFNDFPKHENILCDPVFVRNVEVSVNPWEMIEAMNEAKQAPGKIHHAYQKEKSHSTSKSHLMSFHEPNSDHKERNILSSVSSKGQSSLNSRLLTDESTMHLKFSEQNCFRSKDGDAEQTDPLNLPDINVDGLVMERILNLNIYSTKQVIFRGKHRMTSDISLTDDGVDRFSDRKSLLMGIRNVTLQRLWYYKCNLTENRYVSSLASSKKSHNLLAVGYGRVQYNDDRDGLVCCWNTKNPEFPERFYQTDAGVTSLSFSLKRPNLLAVGLFSGNICVFDLNYNNTLPIVTTNNDEKHHHGPVWQITWKERDRSKDIENFEILMSISGDGRVTQWVLRKEFEATDIMRLKPHHDSQITCVTKNKTEGTSIDRYFSNYASGFCFDLRSNDNIIYLCGMDDGWIHRCSTIYNEKYLNSYQGHTNSVYKVHWSPFVDKIFLSASADWTVRVWMVDYEKTSVRFSSTNAKPILDAIWSPKFPTIFYCISEDTIAIWDLYRSVLDPIYIAPCAQQYRLTTIAYAANSDCLLVGTNEGSVWIYHVENLSSAGTENDLIRIIQENILNQQDSLEEPNPEEKVSLTSIQSD